tara:strand:+ start:157 stop:537 length:381 start_codon:yes stop_codon:yes gene_type:complete
MNSSKKNDNIAKNPNMLPYASNIGAPKIELNDISKWKEERSGALNNYFNEKYDELRESYLSLMKEYESNKLIYNAKFEFVPVIGKTYYLYESDPQNFLSLIDPNSWDKKYLGSFKLISENRWKKIN